MTSFGIEFPKILAQWDYTKNIGLNPSDFKPSSKKKVWWLCSIRSTEDCTDSCKHEWPATIKNRCGLNRGCPYCSGKKVCVHKSISKTDPDIASQWHPTENEPLTKDAISRGSSRDIVWLCPNTSCEFKCQHKWTTTVANRCGLGRGCPYCSNPAKKVCIHNSIVHRKPELVSQWHLTKNVGLNPSDYSIGSNVNIWWQCPNYESHIWPTSIVSRIRSDGTITSCAFCINQRTDDTNCLSTTHPELAKQWHPTNNGDLTASMITAGYSKKVWWLCPELSTKDCTIDECKHEWDALVNNRTIHGIGCPVCSAKGISRRLCKHRYIDYTHPKIASQFHPSKNDDLMVNTILSGSPEPVWWLCDKRSTPDCMDACKHEWTTSPANRIGNERCCPFCSDPPKKICAHMSIASTHPHIATQWHPKKNGVLKPEHYSFGSDVKVWWICPKDSMHEWDTAIKNRCCKGSGCIHCLRKSETKLLAYLRNHYPSVQTQFTLDNCKHVQKLRFDFYIPEVNTIIELDGAQHFRQVSNWHPPENVAKRDVFKMQKAADVGIKVIRISQEDVWNKDEEWLNRELLTEITNKDRTAICISHYESLYDFHISLIENTVVLSDIEIIDEEEEENHSAKLNTISANPAGAVSSTEMISRAHAPTSACDLP